MAHILVVDDERSICELLEITFRKEGHRVEIALNGASARRKLESKAASVKKSVTGAIKKARSEARSVESKMTRAARKARSKSRR